MVRRLFVDCSSIIHRLPAVRPTRILSPTAVAPSLGVLMSSFSRRLIACALCTLPLHIATAQKASRFDARIRWTSYGIPHVTASNWGSLGYGFAYATATDAVCTMARDVVMVNGDLSKHFGPADGNRESDVFHRAILADTTVRAYDRHQSVKSNQFAAGYVAGFNRYLRDHQTDLPTACRGAGWVRAISVTDMTRLTIGVGIRYGLARFQKEMANAAPPGQKVGELDTDFSLPDGIGNKSI